VDVDSRSAGAQSSEEIIGEWYTAFNHRDLDEMLARFDAAIEFRPLRFPGIDHVYEGHEGIRAWFAAVTGGDHVHRIDADEFRTMDDGRILVSGSVSLAAVGGIAPFSGIYTMERGLILVASHYFTPSTVLDRLGIIE
jgi:hypothetical protein